MGEEKVNGKEKYIYRSVLRSSVISLGVNPAKNIMHPFTRKEDNKIIFQFCKKWHGTFKSIHF